MRSFRLGSILGFEIRIDFSWFIIFFLILWTLSTSLFPVNFPGLSDGSYICMGLAGTILFFLSLLAHELSHSLVARAKGIQVAEITLFIFGAVARTRSDALTPGDEFQIAGVGPLTSALIALLCLLIIWLQDAWSIALTGVFTYLAAANLLVALFNLLPGFPLDGGRLFRALVWKLTGSKRIATRIASGAGELVGYLLVFFGFWQFFQGNLLSGLWLVLIGWFLQSAATASYQEQLLQLVLERARVAQAMTRYPETVSPHLTLQKLVEEYFWRRSYHCFPVAENEHPLGIITLNQVKQIPQSQWKNRTVRETMTPVAQNIVVREQENLFEVVQKMQDSQVGRLLVVEKGLLTGVITASDITRWLRSLQKLEH